MKDGRITRRNLDEIRDWFRMQCCLSQHWLDINTLLAEIDELEGVLALYESPAPKAAEQMEAAA
jgi:hypothetical protein